ITNNFFSFKRNLHNLQRGIEETSVRQKSFDRLLIRALLARRSRNRPASKRIKPPGADVIGIRFRLIGLLQRLRLIHVTIGDSHKSRRPLVLIASMDGVKSLTNVAWVEPNQRILAHFGTADRFSSDFID